jgi:hypothetical protein
MTSVPTRLHPRFTGGDNLTEADPANERLMRRFLASQRCPCDPARRIQVDEYSAVCTACWREGLNP